MNDVATTDRPPVLMVECHFPLLPKEQICISFQVLPIDAPQYFYERAHGEDAGERGVQAGNGELFEEYKNVKFDASSIKLLGLKPVDVYTKWKETPKGSRGVVYFWFAPEADYRNFQDPKFLSYTLSEFDRLASLVYVTGQSFVNPDGPACIVLKGVAQCSERTTLALVECELEGEVVRSVDNTEAVDLKNTLVTLATIGQMADDVVDSQGRSWSQVLRDEDAKRPEQV